MSVLEFSKINDIISSDGSIDADRMLSALTQQVGSSFQGVAQLSKLESALFAIFAAYGNATYDSPEGFKHAKNGLLRLSESYAGTEKSLDVSWVEEVIQKHARHPDVLCLLEKHAYTSTLLMSMFEYAKLKGVLASSEFFWLRGINRTMWYSLNNVGRRVAWPESAGVYNHWLAEKVAQSKLQTLYLDGACQALSEALRPSLPSITTPSESSN